MRLDREMEHSLFLAAFPSELFNYIAGGFRQENNIEYPHAAS